MPAVKLGTTKHTLEDPAIELCKKMITKVMFDSRFPIKIGNHEVEITALEKGQGGPDNPPIKVRPVAPNTPRPDVVLTCQPGNNDSCMVMNVVIAGHSAEETVAQHSMQHHHRI